MTKTISTYYNNAFKQALLIIGIAIINFVLGFLAIANLGDIGAGILVILGGYAIYQIMVGFWVLLVEQNREERKLIKYEKAKEQFVKNERLAMEKKVEKLKKNRFYNIIGFLFGMLCVLMGAFGTWNDLVLGMGIAITVQSVIMLILVLLSHHQSNYYLIKLKK